MDPPQLLFPESFVGLSAAGMQSSDEALQHGGGSSLSEGSLRSLFAAHAGSHFPKAKKRRGGLFCSVRIQINSSVLYNERQIRLAVSGSQNWPAR